MELKKEVDDLKNDLNKEKLSRSNTSNQINTQSEQVNFLLKKNINNFDFSYLLVIYII